VRARFGKWMEIRAYRWMLKNLLGISNLWYIDFWL